MLKRCAVCFSFRAKNDITHIFSRNPIRAQRHIWLNIFIFNKQEDKDWKLRRKNTRMVRI